MNPLGIVAMVNQQISLSRSGESDPEAKIGITLQEQKMVFYFKETYAKFEPHPGFALQACQYYRNQPSLSPNQDSTIINPPALPQRIHRTLLIAIAGKFFTALSSPASQTVVNIN